MNLGIDFGTTNSTVAWYNPGTFRQETVAIGGTERIPSLVCWASGGAERLFGAEAREEAKNAESWDLEARLQFRDRLAASFKTDFAAGLASVSSLNLGMNVSPDAVVAAYLEWLLAQFRKATGTPAAEPLRATFTHPATQEWTQTGPRSPLARLERIAGEAGFGEVRLELEPVAAFREAERRGIGLGKGVLVFDLGGGTLDLVYFRRDDEGNWGAPFLAGAGFAGMAGDAFDEAVLQWLGRCIRKATDNAADLRHVVAVRRLAREAKEALSSQDSTQIEWIARTASGLKRGTATLRREVFDAEAEAVFGRIRRALRAYVEAIGARNAAIDDVLLVGGSTNIPKIREIVREETGARCLRPDDADFLVALGAVELEPWQANVAHPSIPHVLTGEKRGTWKPVAGYEIMAWRKDGLPSTVAWQKGKTHPLIPHVESHDDEGFWIPADGYRWAKLGIPKPDLPNSGGLLSRILDGLFVYGQYALQCAQAARKPRCESENLETSWESGCKHRTLPNITSGKTEGEWTHPAGYVWVDGTSMQTKLARGVRWQKGIAMDDHPNVLSSSRENEWIPETGYYWDCPSLPSDFSVTKAVERDFDFAFRHFGNVHSSSYSVYRFGKRDIQSSETQRIWDLARRKVADNNVAVHEIVGAYMQSDDYPWGFAFTTSRLFVSWGGHTSYPWDTTTFGYRTERHWFSSDLAFLRANGEDILKFENFTEEEIRQWLKLIVFFQNAWGGGSWNYNGIFGEAFTGEGRYVGELSGSLPNGWGILWHRNGSRIEGRFSNGSHEGCDVITKSGKRKE